jgi:hypothetical protein
MRGMTVGHNHCTTIQWQPRIVQRIVLEVGAGPTWTDNCRDVNSCQMRNDEARLGEWIFQSALGKPYTVDGIRGVLYRARDRAQLRKFTLHDLRRTSATAMLNAGVDIRRIQAVLRHGSLDTTMRYLGVRPEGLQEAVEAISGLGVAQRRHSSEPASVSAGAAKVGGGSADYESAALTN